MYKTKQKSKLIDFLKENKSSQLSVNDIIDGVCTDGAGKSTVYRQITKLVDDGTLLRLSGGDGKSVVYQYMGEGTRCNEHFHLKCTACGTLFHLDCEHLEEIAEHINKEHNFLTDMKKTVFYGLCADCQSALSKGRGCK